MSVRAGQRRARALALAGALVVSGCDRPPSSSSVDWAQRLGIDDPSSWVTILDPPQASAGVTLDLFRRRIPILVDLNGRVVHAWPEARVKSRVRLLEDGALLAIARGRGVVEYAWEGGEVWRYNAGTDLPHHDVIRLANGNTLMIVLRDGEVTDDLLEVDRAGREVWRWVSAEHLVAWAEARGIERDDGDLTHLNSVQELEANRWFDQGDERFRPGNLLISARNLDAVFVVDRRTGDVVWSYERELDHQHEALMVPEGMPEAGSILLLDNGYRGRYRDRESRVVAIDPSSLEVTWEYRSEAFYTPTSGVEQPLPNGNVLITSTRGGRVFEVTRAGDIVWEWLPPTQPVRARRYAIDHAPQLAGLGLSAPEVVEPPEGYRWIDPRVHQFARRRAVTVREIGGQKRRLLRRPRACRTLLLPWRPKLLVEYGVDASAAMETGASSAAFDLVIAVGAAGDEPMELYRDRVEPGIGEPDRRWEGDLEAFSLSRATLCVALEPVGAAELPLSAYLGAPAIRPAVLLGGKADTVDLEWAGEEGEDEDMTDDEREAERRHLEALGYVD